MKRHSLFILILVIFVFLIGVFELQVYFTSLIQKNRLIDEEISANLQTLRFLDKTIFSPAWHFRRIVEPLLTQEFLNQVSDLPDVFSIDVTNADGSTFLRSGEDLTIDKSKILSGMGDSQVYDRGLKVSGQAARLVVYKGDFNKIFWITFSQESINKNIQSLVLQNTIIGIFWLLIFTTIFLIIVNSILRPIGELRVLFNKVRTGNLNVRAKANSRTEIGDLEETFNLMVGDLKKSKDALEDAKAALEINVAARTRELQELVNGLESEVQRRTKEVYERMKELERFQSLSVGRELKMIELKKELRKFNEGATNKTKQDEINN